MKADQRPKWLVLVSIALVFALAISYAPVLTTQGVAAQATRQPPGTGRPEPGPGRDTPSAPTAPVPTAPPGPGGPEVTTTPAVLPPSGGTTSADFTWLLAGLMLILCGAGIYVTVLRQPKHMGENERAGEEK